MKEYKGENNKEIFNIYKTLNGTYIEKELCNQYILENDYDIKSIKGLECKKVTSEDINHIVESAKLQNKILIPYYITIFDLQLVINFIVYIDKKHNNTLYINNNLCKKYNITPKSKRAFNRITYAQITEEDLDKIETITKTENPIMKRKYIEIELEDEIKPAKSLFFYYLNLDDNSKYIDRDILEMIRKRNIDIETSPLIIDNKNCYSITDKTLNEFEDASGMRGIEKLFTKISINKSQEIDNKTSEIETIMVYKDCITDKLYIEKDKIKRNKLENKKILLNKECYETSIVELENTHNKKFIIVDIYPFKPIKYYKILVCNTNDTKFIPEKFISTFNIDSYITKKIRINGEIFVNVLDSTIDSIKEKQDNYTRIRFEYKEIVPANKN